MDCAWTKPGKEFPYNCRDYVRRHNEGLRKAEEMAHIGFAAVVVLQGLFLGFSTMAGRGPLQTMVIVVWALVAAAYAVRWLPLSTGWAFRGGVLLCIYLATFFTDDMFQVTVAPLSAVQVGGNALLMVLFVAIMLLESLPLAEEERRIENNLVQDEYVRFDRLPLAQKAGKLPATNHGVWLRAVPIGDIQL